MEPEESISVAAEGVSGGNTTVATASSESKPRAGVGGARNKKGVAGGSTFAPHTTVRKPMTYNLIETELRVVSHLNGVALAAFSFGSFWLSLLLSIFITYSFTADPIPLTATILMKYGTIPCAVMTIGSYALGIWSVIKRSNLVSDIKDETKVVAEG